LLESLKIKRDGTKVADVLKA